MGSSNQAWWDARTPEQRANHSRKTKAGMHAWHAGRSEAERSASNQKRTDAAVMQMWVPKGPRTSRKGGRKQVDPNTPVSNTTLAKIEKASVKRILKDLVGTQPELIKDAIIAGLLAPPPRSFPYVALAAAYLDGKPVDAEPPAERIVDLSHLTRDQLLQRALGIARRLQADTDEQSDLIKEREARGVGLAVIDAVVIPNPEDMTPEQLQEEIRLAQIEVDRTNEEVHRTQAVLRIVTMGGKK
jgi:hypothetical protein